MRTSIHWGEGTLMKSEFIRIWCVHAWLLCLVQLCDSLDCSLLCSSFHGILWARILEWVAISSSGDLPDLGIEPVSPAQQVDFSSHQSLTNLITLNLFIKKSNIPFKLTWSVISGNLHSREVSQKLNKWKGTLLPVTRVGWPSIAKTTTTTTPWLVNRETAGERKTFFFSFLNFESIIFILCWGPQIMLLTLFVDFSYL